MKVFFGLISTLLLLLLVLLTVFFPGIMIDGLNHLHSMTSEYSFQDHLYYTVFAGLIATYCLLAIVRLLAPQKVRNVRLMKDDQIEVGLDKENIRSILKVFFKKFPQIVSSKIKLSIARNKINLAISLRIKAQHNVPAFAEELKDRTHAFIKDLYAREIINRIRFNIVIDEKSLTKSMDDQGNLANDQLPAPIQKDKAPVEILENFDKTIPLEKTDKV